MTTRTRMLQLVGLLILCHASPAHAQVDYGKESPWDQRAESGPDAEVPGWFYNLGVTGLRAQLVADEPKALLIKYVFPKSPAAGHVKVGDLVVGAGGRMFQEKHRNGYGEKVFGADGPISELAQVLEECQSADRKGKLSLALRRGKEVVEVELEVGQKYGTYAPTFPDKCKKSDLILGELLQYLVDHQKKNGSFGDPVNDTFAPLALLASGEAKYLPAVERNVRFHCGVTKAKDLSLINWSYMSAAIVLSEYHLATGEKWVLPELQKVHDLMAKSQYLRMSQIDPKAKKSHPDDYPKGPKDSHGGWGHNPGFEGYGPIAMLTGQGALAYSLMHRCGITIDRKNHDAAYEFLQRGTGKNGYVWYGDKKGGGPEGWADMGRTGASGIANFLSPYDGAAYRERALSHAKVIGKHPQSFPDTHGSPMMGMAYTALAASVDADSFRKLLDANRWWFTMAHCTDGTFHYQPNRDNSYYGSGSRMIASSMTAFIFTLPKRSLVMTGKEAKAAPKPADKPAPPVKPLKVFILAGQSNAQGHAAISTFGSMADDPKTAPLLKEMRGDDGKPKVCEKVWITSVGCLGDAYTDLKEKKGKLTAGFGAPENKIGPEFTFGLTMEKLLDEPVLIIKTSWGGRSLHTDFRPPSAGPFVLAKETQELWDKHPQGAHGIPKVEDRPKFYADKAAATGVYYREMIAHTRKVLKDIKRVVPDYDEKQGYELAGFVWFQGFNDYVDGGVYPNQGKAGGYDLYADLLGHFIRDVRKDLSAPKLPFVIGVMGIDGLKGDKKAPMMHFRNAQRKVAAVEEFKGNVVAVETAPLWDDDLEALAERKERVYDTLEQQFNKAKPKPKEPEKEAARKKALDTEFKPEELKRLNAGVSNGGYHYLGAAKIMAPIGKAFAEATVALLKGEKPKAPPSAKPPEKLGSDNRFSISNVEGWTVYLNRDLLSQYPGETARTMEHLKWELYQIKLAAPALAVTNMQEKNAIWIEYKEKVDLSYHPGKSWLMDRGYSIPRDPGSFMSLSVATHLGDSYRHPFVVFHEFAHGYDYHFIGKGKDYGNKESQANYERMMKEGKYEKVKIWNGKEGPHYARSNRMEYWAESTEAYFAVNDFYPFVRAELREHDPQMAKFIERYWGVDSEQMVQKEKGLVAYQQELRRSGAEVPKRDRKSADKYIPTEQYDKRDIGGWTVYVSPHLMEQPGKCEAMIQLLSYKLHMINHFLGKQGRTQLHEVPIWLEEEQAGAYVRYCGSKKQLADELANPDKFRAVEIRDPQRMLNWALLQQSDVLHQLALACYDRLVEKDATLVKNIQAAYNKADAAGKYKSVLRFDGKHVAHPAMTNEKEYFAELMKCYFLVNDHYPFVRCELKDHDATGYGLIAGLWEGNPAR